MTTPLSADEQLVRSVVAGPVATIRLDSPANRNALSRRLRSELHEALTAAIADAAVRVIVLTHDGPAFCSGADLAEVRAAPGSLSGDDVTVGDLIATLWHSPKPVIAVLRGPARAGGTGIAAACDVVLAGEGVSLAFTEVRIGIIPAVISAPLAARVHPARLHEYFLTGESFSAHRAAEIGLVTEAVPNAELAASEAHYTDLLLQGAPAALAGAKQLVRPPDSLTAELLARLNELSTRYFHAPEAAEGMAAFFERRKPAWAEPT